MSRGTQTATIHRRATVYHRRAALEVLTGSTATARHEFVDRTRVGSRALADLVLDDTTVSGLHCEFIVEDQLRVRDLGSKNGVRVGGVQVVEAMLAPGDVVTLGSSRLRVIPVEGLVEFPLPDAERFHGIVGTSPAIGALIAKLAMAAPSTSTVLVQGETGAGKEVVAEAIHAGSARAAGRLVIVDCGAMPRGLIEAELFGYERGAFTGADRTSIGAFERADGGTLFLDEIGELPLDLQPRLLRVLESRLVQRVGGSQPIPVDVRVVAATNRDLAVEVSAGRYREDLYYRLAVIKVVMPPLRDRLEDLPLLITTLCGSIGIDPAPFFTVESLEALSRHSWPGNVRELRNTLERASLLAEPLQLDVAQPDAAQPSSEVDLTIPLRIGREQVAQRFERTYLRDMLAACGGNISEVARRSGMERISIYRLMRRLGLRERS